MEGVKEEQTELKTNPGLRKRWSRGRKPTPSIDRDRGEGLGLPGHRT